MAKEDETPGANPAEIENLIEQIRKTNLEPGAKEKIERLLGDDCPSSCGGRLYDLVARLRRIGVYSHIAP